MTDKPIDLLAREARAEARRYYTTGKLGESIRQILDALDARETLVVAGNGQKFTMAQTEEMAASLQDFSAELFQMNRPNDSDEMNDAARMIRYLAASLDAANVRYENSNEHLGDTVKSFLWVQELQSKYKGNALLEPLLTKHWGGQIGKLAEELVDVLFAEVANLEKLNNDLLERHSAYVLANPAPIRLAGGQVVRFVSPVTPEEVQLLSKYPAVEAKYPDLGGVIDIAARAEANLPPGDMIPSEASPIMPEIADTAAALNAGEMFEKLARDAGATVTRIFPAEITSFTVTNNLTECLDCDPERDHSVRLEGKFAAMEATGEVYEMPRSVEAAALMSDMDMTDAEFLADVADRLFRTATPAMGFDQGDTDRLLAIAASLETSAKGA